MSPISFPLICHKLRMRRRKPKSKALHHCRGVIKPESNFQLSGDSHFRLYEPIPPPILDNLCGSIDFTRLPKLISKFQDNHGTELKADLKDFLANNQHTTHTNHIKTSMVRANLRCGCLGYSTSYYPCTTVIVLDTGASFGLIAFKSNFIDYVNCNIPVKDVTKVNTVIGIGLTIHKFADTNVKYVFLPCISYHLPTTDVKLLYP